MTKLALAARAALVPAGIILGLALLAACQTVQPTPPAATATSEVVAPTLPAATPQATTAVPPATAAPTNTSIPVATPTSPVATPTAPLTPTPSPTPIPEATFHTVQAGDTLAGIAVQYGVSLDDLVFANGYASLADFVLMIGARVQIPLCEAHEIVAGNTLSAISQMCGLTLDELVTANINQIAPYGALEAVPLGTVLAIPRPGGVVPECEVEPAREQVIEYLPEPEEGIFCLSQMFGISTSTILQANIERLSGDNVYGQTPLLMAPETGAVITITAEDVENGVTIDTIAEWYEVEPEAVTDWNGNPVRDPLKEGQQLFVAGADLIFGRFRSFAPTPTPEATAVGTPAP